MKRLGFIAALLMTIEVLARVGGGDSYGGGSRSGGYSGGSGSFGGGGGDASALFDILFLVIRLCLRYPKVGIPLLIVVGIALFIYWRNHHRYESYYSDYGSTGASQRFIPAQSTRDYIRILSEDDASFSYPVFKDFLYSLYHSYQESRTVNKSHPLSAFFNPELLKSDPKLKHIDGVVIGNSQIQGHKKDLSKTREV